jgi:signal transduction histidine kinase
MSWVLAAVPGSKELDVEHDPQLALLDGLIAHMHDGVLAETDDGRFAAVNASFYRVFGLPENAHAQLIDAPRTLASSRICDPAAGCLAPSERPPGPLPELQLLDGRTLEQEYFAVRLVDHRIIHVWQFRDITVRKREEQELRTSRHRLRDFSAHLEAAREEERRELARALHDEVGQLLTGIRLEVAAAVERFRETPTPASFAVVDRLQAAVGLVDLSIATVQRITTALRPPILDHLGLLPAIKWEAAVFERRTGIRCRVSSHPPLLESREHITVLYRILLEALTNVARHASAGTVWIRVRQQPGRLVMEVRDNGRGISDEALTDGQTMGLLGMRERALAVGGEVRVIRLRAGGTCVTATVPLSNVPPGPEVLPPDDA